MNKLGTLKDFLIYTEPKHLLKALRKQPSINSDPLSFLNQLGKRISAFYDHLDGSNSLKGIIIVMPPYGNTKTSVLPLAYYLALNGFGVLRYDHTNHVGESEGEIFFTTVGQMADDLCSVLDFAERHFLISSFGVVASSLSARAALKTVGGDKRVKFFTNLIGIVNIQGSIYAIYLEDGVEEVLNGISLGIRDLVGFQVDADNFVGDAIQRRLHTLETTLEDAKKLSTRTLFFAADKDPWVSVSDVRLVFDQIPVPQKEFHVLSNTRHQLYENLASADFACRRIVACAEKYLVGEEPKCETILTPQPYAIVRRYRDEQERLKASKGLISVEDERKFWKKYLEKYAYIVNLQDYWNLLDFLDQLLGDWRKGEKILDAGCGIGNFGTFVLVRRLYRVMQDGTITSQKLPLAEYLGIDFVEQAVQQSAATHASVQKEFKGKLGLASNGPDIVGYSYLLLDLNQPLPFKQSFFDKICCNLVLSYLSDPLLTLKELFRVLKKGGRIVVTSLKPYADLSQIYRDFIQGHRTPEELEQARLVLSNVGMIKQKEAEGYYRFFSESELQDLLAEAEAKNVEVFRSLGDQANVAVADKTSP